MPFKIVRLVLTACLMLASQPAPAQPTFAAGDGFATHHTQVKLWLSADTAKPGDTVMAGVALKMDPDWHTYWKNPGEAGSATKIVWSLPSDISAGDIQWPLPQKLPPAEVTTYGYEGDIVLLVPLTLATNLASGPHEISAKVSWLECKDTCIPADTTVQATLLVGSETRPSANAKIISDWQMRVPKLVPGLAAYAWWESPKGNTRDVNLLWSGNVRSNQPDFFPDASSNYEVQSATQRLPADGTTGNIHLRKTVRKFSGDWPQTISGVLVNGDDGLQVTLPVAEQAPANPARLGTDDDTAFPSPPLWQLLLFAFLGGLILNIMPCVLPVIALKILGFVSEASHAPRRVRLLGLVYAAGVLASFLALAGVVIGVRAAGHHPSWGMQFSSPVFIVCLTTLVLLVALNLFGVFEVTLGGRALSAAGGLASRSGTAGAFFNGMLATALATPCTAPFLGTALGFAFTQSAAVIALVFLSAGLGLAAPYVVLSWQPAWLKFLPKPGGWMEKFKIGMGFPMLATVVWLFNIAASSYGKHVLWLGLFLVLTALAAWIFGEFVQRGRTRKTLAAAIAACVLAGAYALALEKELDWRAPVTADGQATQAESSHGITWQPWSPDAVAAARAAGQPVLVDFTADWCLTCQVNKKTSLEAPSVREKILATHTATLIGDYTHFPDAITAELNRYHRAGVPLVLVYPKDPQGAAMILPQILTPNIVIAALDRAR